MSDEAVIHMHSCCSRKTHDERDCCCGATRLVASEARVAEADRVIRRLLDVAEGEIPGDKPIGEAVAWLEAVAAAALHKEQSEPAKPTYRQLTVPTGPTISSGPFREKLFGRRREIAEPPFAEFEGGPDT